MTTTFAGTDHLSTLVQAVRGGASQVGWTAVDMRWLARRDDVDAAMRSALRIVANEYDALTSR